LRRHCRRCFRFASPLVWKVGQVQPVPSLKHCMNAKLGNGNCWSPVVRRIDVCSIADCAVKLPSCRRYRPG
jgi:hypothetical protein